MWDKVLGPVADKRTESGTLKLFPVYLKGEDLFGLTVPAVAKITESVCSYFLLIFIFKDLVIQMDHTLPQLHDVMHLSRSLSAPRSGGLREVLFPLWAKPSCGVTFDAQPSRQCPRTAEDQLSLHLTGHKVTPSVALSQRSLCAHSCL